MGIRINNLFIDNNGDKRCKFLGKKYPEDCNKCKHYVSIFCGCDMEDYRGEGLGAEEYECVTRTH